MESNETSVDELRRNFCNQMRLESPNSPDSIEVLVTKLSEDRGRAIKQDSLENFKCRLRRSQGFSSERRSKPVIAKHPSATQLTHIGDSVKPCRTTSVRPCRTPSPGQNSRRKPSPGFLAVSPRRRSSPGWKSGLSRACSPLCNNPGCRRRMPSPCFASCCSLSGVPGDVMDCAQRVEALKRRVRKAQRARFYLLQRPGPHSFSIGGDLPAKNKFKIIIGPQSCTCGHGPHCVHILFVMLRVFQVSENDPRLFAKDLKNFEVESLFEKYEQRRKSQAQRKTVDKRGRADSRKASNWSAAGRFSSVYELSEGAVDHQRRTSTLEEDENLDLCPICLLEMVEGEGLTTCKTGCKNQLHHHCISIWAEECRQRGEPVLCPLCRAVLSDFLPHSSSASSSGLGSSIASNAFETSKSIVEALVSPGAIGTRVGSCRKKTSWPWRSTAKTPDADASEASSEALAVGVVPSEHRWEASNWSRVYGSETVPGLFAREWSGREEALRRVNRHLSKILTAGTGTFTLDWITQAMKAAVGILSVLTPDPVYKVYVGCMRLLRTVLSSPFIVDAASNLPSPCCSEVHQQEFTVVRMLQPILNSIVLKCADSNRRTSQLSLATLVELGKGAEGQLGAYVAIPGVRTAVEALLDCLIQTSFPDGALEWQWALGRLLALEQLVSVFPGEFTIEYVPLREETNEEPGGSEDSGYVLRNFNKIMAVQDFACLQVASPHAVVARTARRLFVTAAQSCCDEPAAYNEVCVMMSKLDPSLRQRLQKKIKPPAGGMPAVENPSIASVEAVAVAINERLHRLKLPAKPRGLSSKLLSPLPTRRLRRLVVKQSSCSVVSDGEGGEILAGNHVHGDSVDLESPADDAGDQTPLLPAVRPMDLPLSPGYQQQQQGKQKRARWFQFQRMHLTSRGYLQQLPRPDASSLSAANDRTGASKNEPMLESYASVPSPVLPVLDAASVVHRDVVVRSGTPTYDELETDEAEVVHCVRAEVVPLRRGLAKAPLLPSLPTWRPRDGQVLPIEPVGMGGTNLEALPNYHEGSDWVRGPLLGTGAFSSVYQAWDVATGRIMAVKQVSLTRNSNEEQDLMEEAVKAEVGLMTRLDHPNIVKLTGASREGPVFNVFSDWMPGGSLAMLLERYGPFSEPVILRYIRQVVDGLAYLHDNNVLHRDLKGANLLVDKDGWTVKIGDFGAAAQLTSHPGGTGSGELQGQLTGTVAFMAPEVLRGDNYGRKCDVWSVGCCVIEMATARPPWDQPRLSNHVALMFKIACTEISPPLPVGLSPSMRDFALRCLEVNASMRPSARDLLEHAVFSAHEDVC